MPLKILILFLYFLTNTELFAGTLSGIIKDSSNSNPIYNAQIFVSPISGTWSDSTFSDHNGKYQFSNIPVGTYKLSASQIGYFPLSVLFVWANRDTAINFTLIPLPSGTVHSGIDSGIWIPSGNPHRIIGDLHISRNLYIAPGCTVISYLGNTFSSITIDSNLIIGSNDSASILLNNISIYSLDKANLSINNGTLFNCKLGGSYHKVNLNSTVFQDDSSNLYMYADSLQIENSKFQFILAAFFFAQNIVINNSSFYSDVMLPDNRNGNFNSNYSNYIKRLSFGWGNEAYYSVNLNHCNVRSFDYLRPTNCNFSMSNSIASKFTYNCSQINSSINHCIFSDSVHYSAFGFLIYDQTNANGDNCDTWFNMKCDPLFVDSTHFSIYSNSPALHAASDGSNIGCYQSKAVGIQQSMPSKSSNQFCSFRVKKDANKVSITLLDNKGYQLKSACLYNIQGKLIPNVVNILSCKKVELNLNKVISNNLFLLKIITTQNNITIPLFSLYEKTL